jgi:uncharacterized protein with von Willebrand factor type A (vWA) domain
MPRTVLIPPRQHCWVESDAFDRSAFAALVADTPSLGALIERGSALVPHFRELTEDLFCLLFKLEPRWRAADEVALASAFNHELLAALRDHPLLESVRAESQLDEMRAGLGTLLLGEHLLTLLREERLLTRGDLLDLWDLERREEELRRTGEELGELGRTDVAGDTRAKAERAVAVAQGELRQKSARVAERLAEMPARARAAIPAGLGGLRRELSETTEQAQSWGKGLGAGGRHSAGRQIELGRRLVTNPKLRRLAALVGRMREQALALRRSRFERASEETFDVELGRTLDRLLPPELLALRHPALRRDLLRRHAEGQLLCYRLRGADDRGRGPMIVCLDGSSSMAGEKEIWSKAVALTLLEIARRQRRLFRFVGFSSPDTPLFTLDLNPRDHHLVRDERALDVAEYFPGGGTDFEVPLDAALATLTAARYRRGDVVLITDGECQVSAPWLEHFRREKRRLGFSLYSVLIDVGPSSTSTLADLSDRVTSVSRLTDAAACDLFVSL